MKYKWEKIDLLHGIILLTLHSIKIFNAYTYANIA